MGGVIDMTTKTRLCVGKQKGGVLEIRTPLMRLREEVERARAAEEKAIDEWGQARTNWAVFMHRDLDQSIVHRARKHMDLLWKEVERAQDCTEKAIRAHEAALPPVRNDGQGLRSRGIADRSIEGSVELGLVNEAERERRFDDGELA